VLVDLTEAKSYSPLKIGLLVTAVVWFLFSFHEFFKAMVNINEYLSMGGDLWVFATDISGVIGLVARTVAGAIAVTAVVLFLLKGRLSQKLMQIFKVILVVEIVYCLSLLISGIWGIYVPITAFSAGIPAGPGALFITSFLINTGIPCLVQSITIPIALIMLILALRPNKPQKDAIKWGLIAGTLYIFVFWLNNATSWIIVVMDKGAEYVTAYPDHILSFGLTTFGLLALALYAVYFTKKSIGTESWRALDLRKIGAIITAVGLSFLVVYVLWITMGTQIVNGEDIKWSGWYAWLLGHNMDLWVLSLPLLGVPLLFYPKPTKTETPKP
jgi:hypothetical protein